jgi:hypothetical protein
MVIDLVSDSEDEAGGGGGGTQEESALEMLVTMGVLCEEASMALSQVWEETVQRVRAHSKVHVPPACTTGCEA